MEPTRNSVNWRPLAAALAQSLAAQGGIRTAALRRAVERVPRHLFSPPHLTFHETYCIRRLRQESHLPFDPHHPSPEALDKLYGNYALDYVRDGVLITALMQPLVMCDFIEELQVLPGHRVLDIGTGPGYAAALLAELTGDHGLVYTIDISPEVIGMARRNLARAGYGGVQVLCGDGAFGHPPGAPYDGMLMTVSSAEVSPAWLEQLGDGGRLACLIRTRGIVLPATLVRRGDRLEGRFHRHSYSIMAMEGEFKDEDHLTFPAARFAPILERRLGEEPGPEVTYAVLRGSLYPFLALSDPRAALVEALEGREESGWGLVDEAAGGAALVVGGRLVSYGERSARDRLVELLGRWEALGRPPKERFGTAFYLPGRLPPLAPGQTLVPRRRMQQVVWLEEG